MTSDEGGGGRPAPEAPQDDLRARNIGVGCFTTFVGFWSGGMVAVLIGKVVAWAQRAPGCEGVPICNWHYYWFAGAAVGAVSLPILVLMRLRRR